MLLALRDVRVFVERLESTDVEEWRRGWASSAYAPQDVGVLREWEAECEAPSPYRAAPGDFESQTRAAQFRALREFLEWYEAHGGGLM